VELVRRGLTTSRELARLEIEKGNVTVAGAPALKAARLVAPDESLAVRHEQIRFVSRGGNKLEHALERFDVPVAGRLALDAGASTGGFTDCLLQRGASKVIAVDVGHGQLHERLRTDPRVHVVDRTNVRYLTLADLASDKPADLVVADLSFISLRVLAEPLLGLSSADADLVVLVKPQFEAGREAVAKGRGVISDPAVWRAAVVGAGDAFAALGAVMMSVVASPILGAQGNAEFLAHVRWGGKAAAAPRLESDLDAAIETALKTRESAAKNQFVGRG